MKKTAEGLVVLRSESPHALFNLPSLLEILVVYEILQDSPGPLVCEKQCFLLTGGFPRTVCEINASGVV